MTQFRIDVFLYAIFECEEFEGSEPVFQDNVKLRKLIREKEEKLSIFVFLLILMFE